MPVTQLPGRSSLDLKNAVTAGHAR